MTSRGRGVCIAIVSSAVVAAPIKSGSVQPVPSEAPDVVLKIFSQSPDVLSQWEWFCTRSSLRYEMK